MSKDIGIILKVLYFMRFDYILLAALLVGIPLAAAEENPEKSIEYGIDNFKAGEYQKAIDFCRKVLDSRIENDLEDAALYLLARSQLRLGRIEKASSSVEQFLNRYPASKYIDHSKLLQAEILYLKKFDIQAYLLLLSLLRDSADPQLKAYISDKLYVLLRDLPKDKLLILRNRSCSTGRDFIDRLVRDESIGSKILVLYSPADSAAGLVISGLQAALTEYSKSSAGNSPSLELVELSGAELTQYLRIRDYVFEPVVAVICMSKGSAAVLHSAAGSWLNAPYYILNDDTPDLWKVGENIWQLQPDQAVMGRKLAEFAVSGLRKDRFITLAPLDDPRMHFVEEFIEQATLLEADVVGSEWFYLEAEDLGRYFKSLRRIGYKLQYTDSLLKVFETDTLRFSIEKDYPIPDSMRIELDSLTFTILIDTLTRELQDTLWNLHVAEQIDLARFQRFEVDSNDIPLTCFDALVFPLKAEEADMYINQFAFYNLNIDLFSLATAFKSSVLEKHRKHLKNLKVVDWSKRMRDTENFYRLSDIFYTQKGRPPEDEEIKGFDTMNFVLNRMHESPVAAMFADRDIEYHGIHFDFNFPAGQRNNNSVNFFAYNGWSFVPIAPLPADSISTENDIFNER